MKQEQIGTDIIGRVQVIYDEEAYELDVGRDGSVRLPDGTSKFVGDDVLQSLLDANKSADAPPQSSLAASTVTPPHRAAKPKEKLAKDENKKTPSVRAVVITIVITITTVLALLFSFVCWPELWAQAVAPLTNSYRVAVAMRDITAGDTIADVDIGFTTISGEVYDSYRNRHFVNDAGALVVDSPIFFVNRGTDVIPKFATADIPRGTILLQSSVSEQKKQSDLYTVETIGEDGSKETTTIDGNAFDGDTTIQYLAIVTTSDGKSYRVPLSTLKLRDKTINDILGADSTSLFKEGEVE